MGSSSPRSIGYGYSEGANAPGVEFVRRARKIFDCEGVVIDADLAPPGIAISPATGPLVSLGSAAVCVKVISPGDLYVALEFVGEYSAELFGSYRHTGRTCISCAIDGEIIIGREVRNPATNNG